MSRRKIWKEEDLISAVQSSRSIRQVLIKIGLKETGENYYTFHREVKRLCLDTSHFTGQAHLRGRRHNWTKSIPLQEVLVENSTYSKTSDLKKRLVKDGLLKNVCHICGLDPNWNGKPLSLQLDHINGVRTDHRLENLRILCPNCHSQTDTFCSRNVASHRNKMVRAVGVEPTKPTF